MRALLLTAVAASAILAASPAYAQSVEGSVSGNVSYNNEIDTQITTDVTYWKLVGLFGGALVRGVVEVDSSAVAVNDVKQISGLNAATYREENELNGENGYVSDVFGPGWSEAGNDPNDGVPDGILEDAIRVGFFAPIINTVEAFDIGGTGNIGVNLSAGYYNMQMNSAVLASSEVYDPANASGGWAEASATSLQLLAGTSQFGIPDEILDEDEEEFGGGGNNFRDRNTLVGGTVGGAGNVGVNAAAGSFNQQANLMTMAVATNAVLAEANSGLIQTAFFNQVEQQDSINLVGALTIADAAGNIGVNMTAGVGNQQLNSLTIATSAGGVPTDPTTPPGPVFPNDPS
jgi:hypothetical protein